MTIVNNVIELSEAVMKRTCAIGRGIDVLATRSATVAAHPPSDLTSEGALSFHCVARTSLDNAIQQGNISALLAIANYLQ
jgi:hypothetical protein